MFFLAIVQNHICYYFYLGCVIAHSEKLPAVAAWIRDYSFGFRAQAGQLFHPSGVSELVTDLSGKDKAQISLATSPTTIV